MKFSLGVYAGAIRRRLSLKLLLAMKLVVLLMSIATVQVSAKAVAQSVTLSVRNAPLSDVFATIEKQTGYHFFWRGAELSAEKVSVKLKNAPLKEAVSKVLGNLPYTFSITKKSIVVRAAEKPSWTRRGTVTRRMLQQRVVGLVTDSLGNPLSGVSIQVKGTLISTLTNDNGAFTLDQVPNGAVLVVSSIGYATREVAAGQQMTIVLSGEVSALDEVVVVAYGTVRKADFTGSATTISPADLDKRPISNPLVALQGAGPGIQTTAPSGGPGSSPGIRIRGIGSYSASNSALVVVDGVEFTGGMSNINPEDIESISILKDAATIAMYGSRGANGVIMITTKKGSTGKSTLDFKFQFGVNNNAVPSYNTVNPGEYYELMWEAYKNSLHYGEQAIPMDIASQIASGLLPRNGAGNQVYDGESYQDIVQYLGNYNAFNVPNNELLSVDGKLNPGATLRYAEDLNWLDQASRTGKRNEYGMTYSTGFNKTDLYTSLNYLEDEGWGLRSSMNRFAARVNVNSQLTKWFKAGANLFANHNKYNNASTGDGIVNPFYFSRSIAPIYPVHVHDPVTGAYVEDELGNRRYDIGNLSSEFGISRPFNSGRHAIAENLWNIDHSTRDFIGARSYIDINFLPWLTFTANLSADVTNTRQEDYQNTIVGDGAPAGRYSQDWERRLSYTFNQILRMDRDFGLHNLNALIGHENFDNKFEGIDGMRTGEGFADFYVYSNFTDIASLNSGLSESAMESYFARANYNFDSRYYLSASVRYDGDSRMPQVNRWSPFWSVGLAWRLDNETFFDADWVDMLKLRGSYGRLGNNNLGDLGNYPYQPGYAIGNNNASAPGVVLSELGSPDLRWEGQKPLDIGVDFSFFDGRLFGTLDYYNRISDGLLFEVRQPYHNGGTTSGSFTIQKNVGDMQNTGIELSVTGNLIRREHFNWNLTFNITTLKNEILKMPVETPEIVSSPYRRAVGHSMNDYYTRRFYGVDPDNGRVLYLGVTEYDAENDDIKLIDNGNGRVDTVTYNHNLAKQDWIGKSALAKAYGSLASNFSYRNFGLGFVLMYSVGGWANDGQYGGFMSSGPSNGANLHRDLLNGWRQPGDQTDIPRMDLNQTSFFGATSTRFLTRADYLSISSVNLSYRLPADLVSRAHIKGARVFVSGENLAFFTHRKGMNTVSNFNGVSGTNSYSPARVFNVGINLSL